jgi:hypothetical protein
VGAPRNLLVRGRGFSSAECEIRVAECEIRVRECEIRVAECEIRVRECEIRVAECGFASAECEVPSAATRTISLKMKVFLTCPVSPAVFYTASLSSK